MPDERQDSIRQGIHAPEESETGQRAAEENRRRAAESPEIGGAMGGTSDADRPADEALYEAQRQAAESEGPEGPEGPEDLAGPEESEEETRP